MRWLVCGGRDFGDLSSHVRNGPEWLRSEKEYWWGKGQLDRLAEQRSVFFNPNGNWMPFDIEIIHGGARGGDRIGDEWAVLNWCNIHEFKADWEKYGKRAGYLRNVQMLEEGKPDLVIAFPGGTGTAMMVDLALKAGVEVADLRNSYNKDQ